MSKIDNKLKYFQLTEYLRDEILMGRVLPGDKLPSENALAQQFALSRQTVRKSLSMLIHEGYIYAEQGKGTFCADRSKKRNESKNIAVLTTYISEYIFPEVIHGIDRVISQNGYSILLKNTGNNAEKEADCLEDILRKNIEGLIIEPTKSALYTNNIRLFDALDKHNIPYLFIHGYYQQMKAHSCLLLDDVQGMYAAVDYLIKLGHKSIAGIFKADDIQGLNRHKGYAKALNDAGIPYDPDRVIWFHTEDRDQKPFNQIRSMIVEQKGLDAVACYNDQIAFGVYDTLGALGVKIPDDISLTGFDDSYLSANCPVKITTVRHPQEEFGETAAQMLLDLLKNNNYKNQPLQKTIVPQLIVKESCKNRNT